MVLWIGEAHGRGGGATVNENSSGPGRGKRGGGGDSPAVQFGDVEWPTWLPTLFLANCVWVAARRPGPSVGREREPGLWPRLPARPPHNGGGGQTVTTTSPPWPSVCRGRPHQHQCSPPHHTVIVMVRDTNL